MSHPTFSNYIESKQSKQLANSSSFQSLTPNAFSCSHFLFTACLLLPPTVAFLICYHYPLAFTKSLFSHLQPFPSTVSHLLLLQRIAVHYSVAVFHFPWLFPFCHFYTDIVPICSSHLPCSIAISCCLFQHH